jgi:hypothetical protein
LKAASKPHPPKTPLEKDMVALMKKRDLKSLAADKAKKPAKK